MKMTNIKINNTYKFNNFVDSWIIILLKDEFSGIFEKRGAIAFEDLTPFTIERIPF